MTDATTRDHVRKRNNKIDKARFGGRRCRHHEFTSDAFGHDAAERGATDGTSSARAAVRSLL
jgi:hypothetical protein